MTSSAVGYVVTFRRGSELAHAGVFYAESPSAALGSAIEAYTEAIRRHHRETLKPHEAQVYEIIALNVAERMRSDFIVRAGPESIRVVKQVGTVPITEETMAWILK